MIDALIIQQTYKTAEIREEWRPYQASWKAHHPGWEYRFWTDQDNRSLIATAGFTPTWIMNASSHWMRC